MVREKEEFFRYFLAELKTFVLNFAVHLPEPSQLSAGQLGAANRWLECWLTQAQLPDRRVLSDRYSV